MEEEKKYSNSYNEAKSIMEMGPTADNNLQIIGWINRTKAIINGYRDGFISDKDIKEREAFMTGSFHRENMLQSALGLLEKSSDPRAKDQINVLQHHLTILRSCRAKLTRSTPPKEVAKRIQKRQIEARTNKIADTAKTTANIMTGGTVGSWTPPSASEALLGALLLMELKNAATSRADLQDLLKKGNLTPEAIYNAVSKTAGKNLSEEDRKALAMKYIKVVYDLKRQGFSDDEIRGIVMMNAENAQDAQAIENMFMQHHLESAHIKEDLTAQSLESHITALMASIRRYDVMHNNAYDYSIVDPQQKISEKTPEQIALHQEALRRNKTAQLFSGMRARQLNTNAQA